MVEEVPEGRCSDSKEGSGGFRYRSLMRFRRVMVQIADEVSEGYGADC